MTNKTIVEQTRCLRLNAGLPKSFWIETVNIDCYLINRSAHANLDGKIAKEVWIGEDYFGLRVFGRPAYVHVFSDQRSKLDPKSRKCVFLGYVKGVKGYKYRSTKTKKMVISRDAVFNKALMLKAAPDEVKLSSGEGNNKSQVVQV